ncbi:MAG: LON peptidase substrate-binding domain-containing protein [Deltaproteobacteria bacterium]|nr:LON peptidase substrate-binding domain-containing protein [Deltaproteobacteria bacterium]
MGMAGRLPLRGRFPPRLLSTHTASTFAEGLLALDAVTLTGRLRAMPNVNSAPKSLPAILPVFPLTGVLVFPGMVLPLHIFEPRYRSMVADALHGDGVFGMIQPLVPGQDNRPLPGAEKENPDLYDIGCAGYIETWEKLPDGRYVLQLRGLSRFRREAELQLHRGYRRVRASYDGFRDSPLDKEWRCDRAGVMAALSEYATRHGLQLKLRQLKPLSDMELVNILGMSLPFHPSEKQALLEAPSLEHREIALVNLLQLGSANLDPEEGPPPRTVH